MTTIEAYDPKVYDPTKLDAGLHEETPHLVRLTLATFGFLGVPRKFLDVGCGVGQTVEVARRIGLEAQGVELYARPGLMQHDLREPLKRVYPQGADLVFCMEVGEHLPEESADTLCQSLRRQLADDGVLVWTAAIVGQPGLGHINCVLPGTAISSSDARAAMRRWYAGEVITIKTASGHELAVTPNHPVFTSAGWKSAQFIYESSHDLGARGANRISVAIMPDHDGVPACAEEIFEAFGVHPGARRSRMPQAPEDFHGDGANGEVEVIRTDGQLKRWFEPFVHEKREEQLLQRRNPGSSQLAGVGSDSPDFRAILSASSSLVRGHNGKTALFRSQPSEAANHPFRGGSDAATGAQDRSANGGIRAPEVLRDHQSGVATLVPRADSRIIEAQLQKRGFALRPDGDSMLREKPSGQADVHVGEVGELPQGFAGEVRLNEVVEARRSWFEGHVYNFETTRGWYVANGIVTHNCQPKYWWCERMWEAGLEPDHFRTASLHFVWSFAAGPLYHLPQNLNVFKVRR